MILDLARLWGRDPGWWYTLPRDEQTRLLAWYRVYAEPGPEAASNSRAASQPTRRDGIARRGRGAVKGRR